MHNLRTKNSFLLVKGPRFYLRILPPRTEISAMCDCICCCAGEVTPAFSQGARGTTGRLSLPHALAAEHGGAPRARPGPARGPGRGQQRAAGGQAAPGGGAMRERQRVGSGAGREGRRPAGRPGALAVPPERGTPGKAGRLCRRGAAAPLPSSADSKLLTAVHVGDRVILRL